MKDLDANLIIANAPDPVFVSDLQGKILLANARVHTGVGTVVTTRVDGVPHRVLRTTMVDQLEGRGRASRAGGLATLVRSARNAAAFRGLSGMGWPEMLRQGRDMRRDTGLSWGQVLMAANTPVLLRAAMVDGRTDLGLMSSGQVAGLIDDLPSCAELIESIMAEAGATLDRLEGVRKA